jgi:hypothetical protein
MASTAVCGLDGSDESFAATNIGLRIAEAVHATAVLVHAVPEPTLER